MLNAKVVDGRPLTVNEAKPKKAVLAAAVAVAAAVAAATAVVAAGAVAGPWGWLWRRWRPRGWRPRTLNSFSLQCSG